MPRLIIYVFVLLIICTQAFADSYLKEVITYLASDQLEGRKPGQNGNVLATNYIEDQLKTIGLEPLGKSYKQDFTIFTEMIKNGENSFKIKNRNFDFEPITYSLSGEALNKEIIFAGFGISIPKNDPNIEYDDYKGLNVKDRIVILFTGDPGIGNRNSIFRKPEYLNYSSLFYKLKNAIAHGAAGVLLINDPLSLTNYPNEDPLHFNNTEGGGNRFSILAGMTTNKFVNYFLKVSHSNTLRVQKKIAKTQKPFSFPLYTKGSLNVHLKKKTGRVSNIVGVLKGSDPKLKNEVIVIGAHMDHLGFGGESSMEPGNKREIHNGADDNASGTAGVLSLAKKIKKLNPKRTYVFTLFNAEEMGLIGSTHFVNMWAAHEEEYGQMKAMLNFDMIGRYDKELSVMGVDSSLDWKNELSSIQTQNFNVSLKKEALGSSDHAAFLNKKIPALFFTTGAHGDYHRPSDDTEKINFTELAKTINFGFDFVKNIDQVSSITFNPNYTVNDGNTGSRGYGAHLGCVPQFGQSDDIVGVLCTGTSENSPARQAGVLSGDIITEIGDVEIKSIYDLAFALKYYRAGDSIKLSWMRGETLHSQMIVLARSRRH